MVKRNLVKFRIVCITIAILTISFSIYDKGEREITTTRNPIHALDIHLKDFVMTKLKPPGTKPERGCSKSRDKIVKQFRSLTRQYIDNSTNKFDAIEGCTLPRGIEDDERFHVMMKRVKSAREACQENPPTELMAPLDPNRFYQDKTHHVIVCKNAKAASTALYNYLNVLQMFTVVDVYSKILKSIRNHTLLKQYYYPPVDKRHLTLTDRKTDLAFPVVRHPFQRALSCYMNKVVRTNSYKKRKHNLYKRIVEFSAMTTTEAGKIMDEIMPENQRKSLKCIRPIKSRERLTLDRDLKKPTFRGFVLATAEMIFKCKTNLQCMFSTIDAHYLPQSVKCSPCNMNYDLIVKTETFRQDLVFIEKLMDLPPIHNLYLDFMTTEKVLKMNAKAKRGTTEILFNVSIMDKSFSEYMKELSKTELDWLYTAYFPDFLSFSYDPCEGLETQE